MANFMPEELMIMFETLKLCLSKWVLSTRFPVPEKMLEANTRTLPNYEQRQ